MPANNFVPTATFVSTLHNDTYPYIDPLNADYAGKTVFITGASKGIGRVTALSYARAGTSRIALGARSGLDEVVKDVVEAAKTANRPAPEILALKLDITSEASTREAADKIAAEFGSIDVLILNAGASEPWKPVLDSDPADWWRTFDVNIQGTYLSTRFLLPLVLKSTTKTIILLSSAGAHQVFPGASSYQMTKLALVRFGEFLDAEYGDQGLVAISVHPGGVVTDMGDMIPEHFRKLLGDTPELSGDSLAFLGGKKRDWLSGRFVVCNWDMEQLEAKEAELTGSDDKLRFRMFV